MSEDGEHSTASCLDNIDYSKLKFEISKWGRENRLWDIHDDKKFYATRKMITRVISTSRITALRAEGENRDL